MSWKVTLLRETTAEINELTPTPSFPFPERPHRRMDAAVELQLIASDLTRRWKHWRTEPCTSDSRFPMSKSGALLSGSWRTCRFLPKAESKLE